MRQSMKIVAITGSLRTASSNTALLCAMSQLAPPDVEIVLYEELGTLPHFNPDLDEDVPPESVARLRALLQAAAGVLISSPEYAHGVPGSLKNLLDWLVSAGELVGKPVAFDECVVSVGVRERPTRRDAEDDVVEDRHRCVDHAADDGEEP